MNKSLNVYQNDKRVGKLSVDDNGMLIFQYDETYLESKEAIPISHSLSLRSNEYYGGEAHTFFTGLLPEEGELRQIARSIGTDSGNSFRLLYEIGKECIGAIRIGEHDNNERPSYQMLEDGDWKTLLQNVENRTSYLVKEKKQRLSLAGAQSKMGVLDSNGAFYIATYGAFTNCIIKFPSAQFPNITDNEFACLYLADLVGIKIPTIALPILGGEQCFAINRYDREYHHEELYRLRQEDFCQALGVLSQNKYEKDGGPSFGRCIQLIRNSCTIPAIEINRFISLFIFNIIIGNRDAHGKNYSLLSTYDNKIILAPAYDIVCTAFYSELSDDMAMKIHEQYDDEFINENDFKQMLGNADISFVQFRKIWNKMIRNISSKLELLLLTPIDQAFAYEFIILINKRIAQLENLFKD